MAVRKKSNEPVDNKKAEALRVSSFIVTLAKKALQKDPVQLSTQAYDCIPSGSIVVDYLVGGGLTLDGKSQICPGYPRRRITEIYGKESSGKTTLALTAVANCQKEGGSIMYLDFEHALDRKYATKLCVTFDETFLIYQPQTMEEGFKLLYIGLKAGVDLIVVDSVAALVPSAELEKPLDSSARIGAVASFLARQLPKVTGWLAEFHEGKPGTALVFINQERAAINTSGYGGAGETGTAGGKALRFYCTLRLSATKINSEYIERKDKLTGKKKRMPYANVTNIKVVKNKIDATQGQMASITIRYGLGVDNLSTMIETGVTAKVVKKEGAYYSYEGQRFQGREKFRSWLMENQPAYEKLLGFLKEYFLSVGVQEVQEEDDVLSEDDDAMLAEDLNSLEETETVIEGEA